MIEGVYHNSHFVHSVTSHVGNIVQVQTQSGALYEGIFRTFSPHFDVALEIVHRIEDSPGAVSQQEENSLQPNNIFDVLIFKPSDIVFLKGKWRIDDLEQSKVNFEQCPVNLPLSLSAIECYS